VGRYAIEVMGAIGCSDREVLILSERLKYQRGYENKGKAERTLSHMLEIHVIEIIQ
jgi:hypothetical protein